GEQAIREPWRLAVAHLADAGLSLDRPAGGGRGKEVTRTVLRTVERMLERRLNCPLTSSAGRLFDAVAALVGLRQRISYEGQAAIELEWLATDLAPDGAYPFDLAGGTSSPLVIDTRPLIRAIVREVEEGIP